MMPIDPLSLHQETPQPARRDTGPHRKVYKTAAWARFRLLRLSQQPICQACDRKGLLSPSVDVHHIVPLRDGGQPYSIANTECLCHSCHSALTRSGQ
jgi:5-methylcytosine-specific restriction protein A